MRSSKVIKRKLIQLFGEEAYLDGLLNKPLIASKIFNDKDMLEKMNAIIHPKVEKRFKKWVLKQEAPYVISEVAILFENNTYKNYDCIITVAASEEERMKRILKRDSTSEKKIRAIMKNQWADAEKIKHSDYVIYNTTLEETLRQVGEIHKKLVRKAQKH
jgi:dephospho-CoA kinase